MAIPKKTYENNPFVIRIDIPNEYFCGREAETAKLIRNIENGNNTVLTAYRRVGKSSLLKHLLIQPEIKENYNTLYVDINDTTNLKEFTEVLCKKLLNSDFAKGEKAKKALSEAIPEINFYARINAGPVNLGMETTYHNEYSKTIDKVFAYLEKTDKPNIIVFDEFQTIEEYTDVKMPAKLRTYIQNMDNTHFIFSGSQKHMLQSMFKDENKPFYKSALMMPLDIIPEETYANFCKHHFEARKKGITDEAVHFAYSLFGANTLELQQIMNRIFSYTGPGVTANVDSVRFAVEDYLEENETFFRSLYTTSDGNHERSEKEKNLIRCIGLEGLASELMGQEKIGTYYLGGPSSVKTTLSKLSQIKKPLITRLSEDTYKLNDKFFELWIADKCGMLQQKFFTAEQQFKKERELIKENPVKNPAKLKKSL